MKKKLLTQKAIFAVVLLFSVFLPLIHPAFGETNAETKKEIYPDTRYDIMVEEELDLEFEIAKYITTRKEKKTYKKLEITAKGNFLKEFWAKHDSDPSTVRNEFRDDYLSRVKYVNEKFGSGKKGWKTDRGRVVLIYGLPDEIEHFTFNSTSKPYQIWHYFSAEGGIKFIFVDKRLFGNFELVHSTARKEIYDKDWERWISPTKETSPSILRFEQQNATTTP